MAESHTAVNHHPKEGTGRDTVEVEQEEAMELLYQGLTFHFPFEGIIQVEDFTLTASFNRYAKVSLLLLAKEEKIQEVIHAIPEGAGIIIREKEILFAGKITLAETVAYRGLYYLRLEAASYTMDWQLRTVSRSFLDLDATYEQVIKKVLEDQEHADIMDCITAGARIPDFLLQYEETDWDFLVRLASHFGSFLIPDYQAGYGRAYFGVPQYGDETFLSEEEYETIKDMDLYYRAGNEELLSQEVMKWRVKTGHVFSLAQRVAFRGIAAIVTSVEYGVRNGELCRYYELSREKGVISVLQKNRHINGMSIPATVKERRGNCVRVHFHIDQEYEPAPNARYFTFAIESSFIYCMPEVGSQVHIYFPTDDEKDAIAVHALRLSASGHGGGGYAQEPDNKSFSNVNGAELLLTPYSASAAAEEGKETEVYLDTAGNVYIEGKEISISAENDLSIGEPSDENGEAVMSVVMQGGTLTAAVGDGETKVELTEEAHILAAFVKMEASDNTAMSEILPPGSGPEDTRANIKAGDEEARNDINSGVSTRLKDKYIEGRTKMLNAALNKLITVATVTVMVAVTVASGGTATPLLLGAMALGGINVAYADAEIEEGRSDILKGQSGDLSESRNVIRDTVYASIFGEENKQAAYEMGKLLNDIAFQLLSGKVIGGGLKAIGETGKIFGIACGSQELANLKTVVQVSGNVARGAATDLINTGSINIKNLALNTTLGIIQGQIGQKATNWLMDRFRTTSKVAEVTFGTIVDSVLDKGVSELTGRPFDLWQSVTQNAFANSLAAFISDPVDAATGCYTLQTTDFILSSQPAPLRIERTYRSTCKETSVLGKGWKFSYAGRLWRDTLEAGRVHLDTITGHNVCFQREEGRWINQSKGTARFSLESREKEGIHILTDVVAHTRCVYDQEGWLMYVEYPGGLRLAFVYTESGLSRITTPLGNVLEVESRAGRIVQITDEIGRRTQYRYEDELLTDVVHTDEGITHYEYDENGSILSVTDQNGVRYLENAYDGQGRIIKQSFASGVYQTFAYDDKNRRNTITYSESGRVEVYEYNRDLLTERILYEDGTGVSYGYSEQNMRILEVSRTGAQTVREYDGYDRLIKESAPDGFTVYHAYDDNHDVIRTWDTDGRETCSTYDNRHNPVSVREKIEEGAWREWRYAYDGKGRKVLAEDALGNRTIWEYAENTAHPVRITTPKGEETVYTYDIVGRRMSVSNAYGMVELSYNSRNFVTRRIDGEGNESRWFYDRMGNLTEYIPPVQWERRENGYRYQYDFLERLVDIINPQQEHERVYRNFEGEIIRAVHPASYKEKGEDGEGTRCEYDRYGRCIRIRYADGGCERMFYDADGNVLRRILPESYDEEKDDGQGFAYTYDRAGRLILVTDPEGACLHRYAYNGHGQLIREEDGEGRETLYTYNGLGLKIREQVSIRQEAGNVYYRVTAYTYDRQGNKTEEAYGRQEVLRNGEPQGWQRIHFAYDANNRLISVRDELGAQAIFEYDCLGSVTREEKVIEEGICRRIHYRYNKTGRCEKKTEEIEGNGPVKRAVTCYGYDGNGNLTLIKTPKGAEIHLAYDSAGRLKEERVRDRKNGIDRITRYGHDAAGRVISRSIEGPHVKALTEGYRYDLKDRLTHRRGRAGGISRFVYDANDRLIREISPYGYDREKDGGAGICYSYDSRGNRIRVINALGQTMEERRYNLQDMPTAYRDGAGRETDFVYTVDGQLKEVWRGRDGGQKSGRKPRYDAMTDGRQAAGTERRSAQQYTYDAQGRITGIVDGNGNRTDYGLDDWGRITNIGFADGTKERYEYIPAGNTAGTVDGNGNRVLYHYNSLGKVRERTDQMGDTERFLYDEEGNLTLYIDRDGCQTMRTYDVFGSLVYEKAVGKNGEEPVISTYRYDSIGRLVQAVCGGHSYEYLYNEKGELKEKRSGGRRLISYVYDKAGKISRITDPSGTQTCYEYDIMGRTSRIYSPEGMEVSYGYDSMNRLERIVYGNGLWTIYEYDGDGNISCLETGTGQETLLSFAYEYDGNGNRTAKSGRRKMAGGRYEAVDISCRYDIHNRLTQERRGDDSVRYAYDAAGNRIRKEEKEGRTKYGYNEKNQLVSEEGIKDRITFTYNRQGSIIREEGSEGIRRYFYNAKNQQTRVETGDGQVQINGYDAEGLRHEVRENGKPVRFVYHDGELLYERSEKEENSYHLGAGTEAARRGGETYYYHQDEQLSTALITDRAGTIRNSYAYDAFGNGQETSEGMENRIRYTGQQYDYVTGQYYLRARYYNPMRGRFLQEDVYLGDGLNLYAYCGNNPVIYFDPSGYAVTANPLYNSPEDVLRRVEQAPSLKNPMGAWQNPGQRGNCDFVVDLNNINPKYAGVISALKAHGRDRVTYTNGMIDMEDFAIFSVDVNISKYRITTRNCTNRAIAQQIVGYGGDYEAMYRENVMGIASGTIESQRIAMEVINSRDVQNALKITGSDTKRARAVANALEKERRNYGQVVHETNLEKGKDLNTTQWVDKNINDKLGHEGGTADQKRFEEEIKGIVC